MIIRILVLHKLKFNTRRLKRLYSQKIILNLKFYLLLVWTLQGKSCLSRERKRNEKWTFGIVDVTE